MIRNYETDWRTEGWYERLTLPARHLLDYCYLNPYLNAAGTARITKERLARETLLSVQDLDSALAELGRSGKVRYYADDNLLVATDFPALNVHNPSFLEGAGKALAATVRDPSVIEQWLTHNDPIFRGRGPRMAQAWQTVRTRFETVSPRSRTVGPGTDTDTVPVPELLSGPDTDQSPPPRSRNRLEFLTGQVRAIAARGEPFDRLEEFFAPLGVTDEERRRLRTVYDESRAGTDAGRGGGTSDA